MMIIRISRQDLRTLVSLVSAVALFVIVPGCDSDSGGVGVETLLAPAPDSFSGTKNNEVSGNVSFNDRGADLSYAMGTAPVNGTVNLSPAGSFTYMPDAEFWGEDVFTVTVTDRTGATASSTVSIWIEATEITDFGWSLVWSDEFNGDTLDAANWTPQLGDGSDVGLVRWGNNELQWYQSENITVEDGNLKITARAEEIVAGFPYTSGRMRSIDKVDIKYGRIEARAKPPAGQGLWSAFWMLPTDSRYTSWAASGEIDIMEVVNAGTSDEAFGSVHHGFPWPLNQIATETYAMTPEDGFHTYAIEWEEDEIRWYIDDIHYYTVRSDHWFTYYWGGQDAGYVDGPGGAPFDVEFHILLNLAVGGWLPGDPKPGTVFPAEMLVDYVRVYQCSKETATGAGCASWVDESIAPPDAKDVFIETVDLYADAAGPLAWTIGDEVVTRDLQLVSFWDNGGALLLSEVAAADPARGMVIDVNTSNSGNFQIWAPDDEGVELFGMGNNPNWWELHAGELKFDLYVDSAGTDLASSLLIKMDSKWPALGFVTLSIADLPLDEWTTVSVKINDLIFNSGDQPLNTGSVNSLFVLEPTGMAHVQVDNIQLVCGHPADGGCGVTPPSVDVAGDVVNVFIDEVDPTWSNGIGAWDDITNSDYFDGSSGNHVGWSLVDTGEAGHDTVIEATFAADGADGVFYIQSASSVDMTSFATGNLVFDLRLPAGATHGITYKIDCGFPCTSGDRELTGIVPGDWQTFEIPISTLLSIGGLELDKVNTGIVIFPTTGQQQGVSFELDNVRWEVGESGGPQPGNSGEIYIDSTIIPWSLWDCCSGSTFTEVLDGDATHGTVAEFTYGPNPAAGGTVNGFEASSPVDVNAFDGGTLEFDVHLVTGPDSAAGDSGTWWLKLEGPNQSWAAEVAMTLSNEGVNPPVGAWQHYTFDLDFLVGQGMHLDDVSLVMIFPTWGTAEGAVVRYDNVKFVAP